MKRLKRWKRLNRQFFVIIPILLAAYGLRLHHIDQQSIWWDEGHSIFVAEHPLTDIPTLPTMDVHPPAYFMLLHSWMGLAGRSEFALRYLSLIFGLLTVALLGRFAQELIRPNRAMVSSLNNSEATQTELAEINFDRLNRRFSKLLPNSHNHQIWIALSVTMTLAALSPMYVAYSQEVRGYSMVTGLALGSTLLLWKITRRNCDYAQIFGYILLTVASLYTHYFTLFLLLFHNLVWLVWLIRPLICRTQHFKPRLFLWLTTHAAILILFLSQLSLAARQITDYANPNLMPPTLSHFLYHSWQSYTIGIAVEPAIMPIGLWVIAGLLLISLAALAARHVSLSLFLLGWLALPLTLYFIVLQSRPSFEPRYLMLITPSIFLILGAGLSHLSRQLSRLIAPPRLMLPSIIIIIMILLLPIVGLFLTSLHRYDTDTAYFKDDSAGVTTWLAQETTPADIILVDVPHPFHYYADRLPAPIEYLFVDVHTAAETLTQKSSGQARLFWVSWRGSDTDPRQLIPFLARKQGEILGQREFRGYHVRWFSLTGQPFSLPYQLEPISATFGDLLRLDGAAYGNVSGHVWVTLQFKLLRETTTNYKVSVRLQHENGSIVAQDDRDLLNDRHVRTAAWPLADAALNQAINVYWLSPPPQPSQNGGYRLAVIVYDAEPPYPSEGVTGANSSVGGAAVIGLLDD